MIKEIEVRCGHCNEIHYTENDGVVEIVYCPCGACGAIGELDLSCFYDILETIYPMQELDFSLAPDELTDRLHLLLDIIYHDYSEYCSAIWCKGKVLQDEELFDRLTADKG